MQKKVLMPTLPVGRQVWDALRSRGYFKNSGTRSVKAAGSHVGRGTESYADSLNSAAWFSLL